MAIRLNENGRSVLRPSENWPKWLLDQVVIRPSGKDQLTIDVQVLDQMNIRRTDIRPSAIRPSGKKNH